MEFTSLGGRRILLTSEKSKSMGFISEMQGFVHHGKGVVVMANDDAATPLISEIKKGGEPLWLV